MFKRLIFITFLLSSVASVNAQELYGYKSGRGVITFTTRKPEGKSFWRITSPTPKYSGFVGNNFSGTKSLAPTISKYDELIHQLSVAYRLEPALVKAVMHVESRFNPQAISNKGARGLMQLMPATASRFGVEDSFHPIDNLVGGVRYLRWLFDRFKGNIHYVLAGYNAGEGAVERYNGIPPYSETMQYVRLVLRMRDSYRCDYSGRKTC